MKLEKLIFGAVLIVYGVIYSIYYMNLGSMGPVIVIIGGIPMIISGVLLMLLGSIQGKVEGKGRNEKTLLVIFILISVFFFAYSGFIGMFLIAFGIILVIPSTKEEKKRRNLKLILSAAVVIIMIIVIIIIMNIPPPVLVTPPP